MRWIGIAERVDRAGEAATDAAVKVGSLLWWVFVVAVVASAAVEIAVIALGFGGGR